MYLAAAERNENHAHHDRTQFVVGDLSFRDWATVGTRPAGAAEPARPNIVFILCDDLGYGDVGCFGQTKIKTPNVDRLAAGGMRLTVHYSGHNVCAPSRCALMTGKHPGHGYIRDNRGVEPEGQEPVPAGELTLPLTLKKLGYTLGGFGKWGLGPVGSSGDPLKQGFDRFYGFNCQGVAHNYYPTHLWDNERHVALDNPAFDSQQRLPSGADPTSPASYVGYAGKSYAPDLIAEQARAFLRANKDRPFFLYFPTTVPHLALQVPEDSLSEYLGKFDDKPYLGDRRYLPHRAPRAAYAAMITRMDREVGRLVELVKELGLEKNTIFVFTSDNGPLYDQLGGTDCDYFNSTGGLRGHKGSYYEGGFPRPLHCPLVRKNRRGHDQRPRHGLRGLAADVTGTDRRRRRHAHKHRRHQLRPHAVRQAAAAAAVSVPRIAGLRRRAMPARGRLENPAHALGPTDEEQECRARPDPALQPGRRSGRNHRPGRAKSLCGQESRANHGIAARAEQAVSDRGD